MAKSLRFTPAGINHKYKYDGFEARCRTYHWPICPSVLIVQLQIHALFFDTSLRHDFVCTFSTTTTTTCFQQHRVSLICVKRGHCGGASSPSLCCYDVDGSAKSKVSRPPARIYEINQNVLSANQSTSKTHNTPPPPPPLFHRSHLPRPILNCVCAFPKAVVYFHPAGGVYKGP